MKVLLVQPPTHHESIVFGAMEPLALEVLYSSVKNDYLLKNIVTIEIIDLRIEKKAFFTEKLKNFHPDIVATTGITIDYPEIIKIKKETKKFSKNIITMVGGHHATMQANDFFLPDCIDFIFLGPASLTFPTVIKKIIERKNKIDIKGVIKRMGKIYVGENNWSINQENFQIIPDRESIKTYRKKYRFDGFNWSLLSTSQGCPFNCTFCSCWKFSKGEYFPKSPEQVIKELATIPEKRIFLADDHTFFDPKRAMKIAKLIKSSGIKKIFQGYSRADTIVKNPEVFKAWADIGLFALTVGIESLDDGALEDLNKKSSVKTGILANNILSKLGVHNYAHILIDPGFSKDDFKKIWKYVYEQGIIHPVFPVLTPLPGTDMWLKMKKDKCLMILEYQFFDLAHPVSKTNMEIDKFHSMHVELLKKNYSIWRWLKAKKNLLMNYVLDKNTYPKHKTRAPELITIIFTRLWILLQSNKKKMNNFFQIFKKKFS